MHWAVALFDGAGAPITGAAALLTLRIRRVADSTLLDWADGTFKASGWGTVAAAATEVSAANYPGGYTWSTAVTGWADGAYEGLYRYAGAPPQNGLLTARVSDGQDWASGQAIRDALKRAPSGGAPAAGSVDAALQGLTAELAGARADLTYLRQIEAGRWRIVGTQMIFYAADGSTPLLVCDLFDAAGDPSAVAVYERRPVAP